MLYIIFYCTSVVVLILSIVIHEVAHGYMAKYLGDTTAYDRGRLSLNPFVHLDWMGSVIIPAILLFIGSGFLFGWAKPVPVDPRFFKNPDKDMMLVAIAGPISNILIAVLSLFGLFFLDKLAVSSLMLTMIFKFFFVNGIILNLVLALFNCIPIPPLDGSRVIYYFLPSILKKYYYKIEPFGFVLLLGALYFGIFDSLFSFFEPIYAVLVKF